MIYIVEDIQINPMVDKFNKERDTEQLAILYPEAYQARTTVIELME